MLRKVGESPEPNPQEPIVRIAHTIIEQAIRDRASEVGIELLPTTEATFGSTVSFVVDGERRQMMPLPDYVHGPLVERYKTMGGLDTQVREAQDGEFTVRMAESGQEFRIGLSVSPAEHGGAVVMRFAQ